MKTLKITLATALLTSLCFSTNVNAQEAVKKDPMQVARGAKAWAQTCNRCHNVRAPKELTDEEWDVSATHMRVRANLPGDMVKDIIAFLQASNNERIEK